MSITSTPRKVRYTRPESITQRVLEDFIPIKPCERSQYQTERWYATAGGPRDRDWTGKGVGCYHGTTHDGKAVLCEGARCKMLPAEPRTRPNARDRSESAHTASMSAARAHRATVDAYIRSLGFTGKITASVRTLAKDALAHAAQVQEYANAA